MTLATPRTTLAAQAGASAAHLFDALASLFHHRTAAGTTATTTAATTAATRASAPPPPPPPLKTYRVKPGDSAASIASAHGISTASLLVRNGLRLRDDLEPGSVLVVERGRGGCRSAAALDPVAIEHHTVGRDESVDALCTRFGVGRRVLLAANGFSTGACITPGITIVVPSSTDPRDTGEVPVVGAPARGVSASA